MKRNVARIEDCSAAYLEFLSSGREGLPSFSSSSLFHHLNVSGKWMMPWVMQAIDTRIVNRSNALTGWRYGRNLVYREFQQAPNMIGAAMVSALFPMIGAMMYFSLTRYNISLLTITDYHFTFKVPFYLFVYCTTHQVHDVMGDTSHQNIFFIRTENS